MGCRVNGPGETDVGGHRAVVRADRRKPQARRRRGGPLPVRRGARRRTRRRCSIRRSPRRTPSDAKTPVPLIDRGALRAPPRRCPRCGPCSRASSATCARSWSERRSSATRHRDQPLDGRRADRRDPRIRTLPVTGVHAPGAARTRHARYGWNREMNLAATDEAERTASVEAHLQLRGPRRRGRRAPRRRAPRRGRQARARGRAAAALAVRAIGPPPARRERRADRAQRLDARFLEEWDRTVDETLRERAALAGALPRGRAPQPRDARRARAGARRHDRPRVPAALPRDPAAAGVRPTCSRRTRTTVAGYLARRRPRGGAPPPRTGRPRDLVRPARRAPRRHAPARRAPAHGPPRARQRRRRLRMAGGAHPRRPLRAPSRSTSTSPTTTSRAASRCCAPRGSWRSPLPFHSPVPDPARPEPVEGPAPILRQAQDERIQTRRRRSGR